MYCRNCGTQNNADDVFCKNCGTKMKADTTPREERAVPEQMQRSADATPIMGRNADQNIYQIPDEYRPISMWGYFGYSLLFGIPIVGIICVLVFAFGGTKNMNLRNFARAQFCMVIVVAVLVIILVIAGAGTLSSMRYW